MSSILNQTSYPVIFLDIDGVMNACECDKEYLSSLSADYFDCVSPLAVERLAYICKQTGAHVMLNGTMSSLLWNNDPRACEAPAYCLPDGTHMLDAMREKGIIVDGVSFDRHKHFRKIEGAAIYLSAHPEISNFIFIEDGAIITDDDKEWVIYHYPELKEIVENMTESMHIDTNRSVDKNRIWFQPIGLSDELAKQAIEQLQSQSRQVVKDMSVDNDDIVEERDR